MTYAAFVAADVQARRPLWRTRHACLHGETLVICTRDRGSDSEDARSDDAPITVIVVLHVTEQATMTSARLRRIARALTTAAAAAPSPRYVWCFVDNAGTLSYYDCTLATCA